MSTKLKDILGKFELTAYEAGDIIRLVADAWKTIINDARLEAGEVKRETERLIDFVRETGLAIVEAQKIQHEQMMKSVGASDECYRIYKAARDRYTRQINDLPKSTPPPLYEMEKALELAERCNRFTDDQWSRVVELAKALGRTT